MDPVRFGAYLLLKSIGEGATSDIHLARPIDPGRGVPTPLVIKILRSERTAREINVRRFGHEARVATAIDSPYVAKVYDVGRVGESLYIAMEYVAGWSLSRVIDDRVESKSPISIDSAADVIDGALRGAIALHGATNNAGEALVIVHRDLSPRNIMLGEEGGIKLIDLGLGKSRLQSFQTSTGVLNGSLGYMAPEQARGERVDRRADIYALGCVLFELLTLEPYIRRGTLGEMVSACVVPRFRAPSSIRSEVPRALDELIARMLAVSPSDRYQHAAEVLADLRRAIPDRSTTALAQSLVSDMLWNENTQEKTAVQEELERTALSGETTEIIEDTFVIAHASGVRLTRTLRLDPANVPKTAVRRGAPDRGGVWRIGAVLLIALPALLIGVLIGRWKYDRRQLESAAVPATSVRVQPAVSAAPEVAVPEVANEAEEKEDVPAIDAAAVRVPAIPRRAVPPKKETSRPVTEQASASDDPDEFIDGLLTRATVLRKRARDGTAQHKSIETLMIDLYGIRSRAQIDGKRAAANRLEERLAELERADEAVARPVR